MKYVILIILISLCTINCYLYDNINNKEYRNAVLYYKGNINLDRTEKGFVVCNKTLIIDFYEQCINKSCIILIDPTDINDVRKDINLHTELTILNNITISGIIINTPINNERMNWPGWQMNVPKFTAQYMKNVTFPVLAIYSDDFEYLVELTKSQNTTISLTIGMYGYNIWYDAYFGTTAIASIVTLAVSTGTYFSTAVVKLMSYIVEKEKLSLGYISTISITVGSFIRLMYVTIDPFGTSKYFDGVEYLFIVVHNSHILCTIIPTVLMAFHWQEMTLKIGFRFTSFLTNIKDYVNVLICCMICAEFCMILINLCIGKLLNILFIVYLVVAIILLLFYIISLSKFAIFIYGNDYNKYTDIYIVKRLSIIIATAMLGLSIYISSALILLVNGNWSPYNQTTYLLSSVIGLSIIDVIWLAMFPTKIKILFDEKFHIDISDTNHCANVYDSKTNSKDSKRSDNSLELSS